MASWRLRLCLAVAFAAIGPSCRDASGPSADEGLTLLAVTTGWRSTCGLAADSTLVCWGWDVVGRAPDSADSECGAPGFACSSVPRAASGGHRFASLGRMGRQACALTAAAALVCWGGVGGHDFVSRDRDAPEPYPISTTLVAVGSGGGHGCGLDTSGTAYCWGWNYSGQLGRGIASRSLEYDTVPQPVAGGHVFTQLTVGGLHSCGVLDGGEVLCWGDNFSGQLGTGAAEIDSLCGAFRIASCSYEPTPVAGGLPFESVAAGGEHTCGVTAGGGLYCWGANDLGQLGTPDRIDTCDDDYGSPYYGPISCAKRPHPTGLPAGVPTALALGMGHSCALAAGRAYCWGSNQFGQLGHAAALTTCAGIPCQPVPPPQEIMTGSFRALSAGATHTCAIDQENIAWCWGDNTYGQLGTGTRQAAARPVRVRAPS